MMATVDIRQRTAYLFLAVVVGHVILISAQVNTARGIPVLEAVVFGGFAEVQRLANSVVAGTRSLWDDYIGLQNVAGENEQLRQEVAQLRVRLQEERSLAQQTGTLQQLLSLKGRVPLATSGANVIAGSAGPEFRTVTIDKGQADGFGADMPVLAPAGVVGRLILPTPRASKVQLLIDRNAAAAALIERSRAQGVVVGTGGPRLHMEYVPGSADVRVGDTVVTSGIDGIYPKGYAIGRIESVQRSAEGWTIDIAPAVDFSSLEAVLVVQGRAPVEPAVPALASTQGSE
jgi:rod shape-determining protein MreC